MRYEIVLAPEACEDRIRLRAVDRSAVDDAMERHLRHQPGRVSKARIKRLRGLSRPQYGLRVNDVRVFYDLAGSEVQVLGIVAKADAEAWLEAIGEEQ